MSKIKKLLQWGGIIAGTLVLMVITYYGEKTGEWLKATLLQPPQPFDGTALPIQKVPNWSKVLVASSEMTGFNEITQNNLIDLPSYAPELLEFPDEKLGWGDAESDRIRNAKITYSVVYLGSYKDNHTENAGSHLAVDIKVPEGTPVYAIANGQVAKASSQETGFGHHIVIKHPDAPDPVSAGQKTALYSVYAHMSDVNVSEGQNVKKGEMIGRSGATGTATTPHLHFQIDRDTAPWHPYWPFTWSEAQQAGLSFFDAVSAGLGKDKAKANTVNPMPYVEKYLNFTAPETSNVASSVETQNFASLPSTDATPDATPIEPPATVAVHPSNPLDLSTFKITGEHFGLLGSSVNLYIEDEKSQVSDWKSEDTLDIQVEGEARLNKRHLQATDFVNRIASITVRSEAVGKNTITIGKNSYEVTFIETARPVSGFKIEHDGRFIKNTPEEIVIIAVDDQGEPTPVYTFQGSINLTAKTGSARFKPETVEFSHFREGRASVLATPLSEDRLVIRAQNGALVGESEPMSSENGQLFADIRPTHKNFKAIKFLKENGIINGYPDGTFKPNQTVNRAEALKMLMLAFGIETRSDTALSFRDTGNSDWYADFLKAGLQKGIVAGYPDNTFRPAQTVNRAEYLKILFRTNNLEAAKPEVQPYEDVPTDAWFAPYAFLANKKNVMPVENRLEPTKGMTRAEVAETIYRMKMIELNQWVVFNKD